MLLYQSLEKIYCLKIGASTEGSQPERLGPTMSIQEEYCFLISMDHLVRMLTLTATDFPIFGCLSADP